MSIKARDLMESMTPIITRGLCGVESTTKADAKIEALIDAALCEEREQFGHAVAKALRENHAFDSDEAIAVLNEAENILLEWRTP